MGLELGEEIQVVELHMMDKRKYYPLTVVSGLTIRCVLYPFMLIKTRLQIQRGTSHYKGTLDALYKISKHEGPRGLYRGFWVSCFQMFPSMAYISTYEGTRHYMEHHTSFTNRRLRAFVAGGCASLVGQTISVPLDIITQHLMMIGQRNNSANSAPSRQLASMPMLNIPEEALKRRMGAVSAVVGEVYRRHGVCGFYKGILVSLTVFTPNSALWWFFYDCYNSGFGMVAPQWVPRLVLQCMSGPLSGISAAVITNPLDVVRARMQVEGTDFRSTVNTLWREEGVWMATKGLSARLVQSVTYSFFIILGYESIKRWSLLEEYKSKVRW